MSSRLHKQHTRRFVPVFMINQNSSGKKWEQFTVVAFAKKNSFCCFLWRNVYISSTSQVKKHENEVLHLCTGRIQHCIFQLLTSTIFCLVCSVLFCRVFDLCTYVYLPILQRPHTVIADAANKTTMQLSVSVSCPPMTPACST